MKLTVEDHPLLALGAFVASWEAAIGSQESPLWLTELFSLAAEAPVSSSDEVRKSVRDLLRHGGFKPSGRSKPASEFLLRAAGEATLGSINLPVDLCNAVSLHAGLPISVIDLDQATPPLHARIADEDASYVFNASGQEIALKGLLCLHDAEGPCANPVKDAQRTKTSDTTTRTLCILWSPSALTAHRDAALAWYRSLTERAGAAVTDVELE